MKTKLLLCFAILFGCATISQGDEQKINEKQSAIVEHKEVNYTAKQEGTKAPVPKHLNSSDNYHSDDKATSIAPTVSVSNEEGIGVSDSMYNATKRAVYLLTGACILVLFYFIWKSYSLKRRQTHIHKYGVVASREDLEMTSLGFGSEDEEDDTTHFDIGRHQRS